MKTVALVMIVKNEGRCLEKCLSRAKGLVDSIYITDTGSSDGTVGIAKSFGAHISGFEWTGDFAAARNYALEQSDCDWNLVLDADEYLISGTREDLLRFAERGGRLGVIQHRNSYREANGEISHGVSSATRFIPRGVFYEGRVHEQIASGLPRHRLPLVFEHDGYLQQGKGERNLQILLEELERRPNDHYLLYQTGHTLKLMGEFERANGFYERFYRLAPPTGASYRSRGVVSYIYNLLELKKYDEGLAVIANEEKQLANSADYHFLRGSFYTQAILSDVGRYISFLPEIERAYLRCLEIGEVPENEGVYGSGSFKAAYNLGVWFEVNGKNEKARRYYQKALDGGYRPAAERIKKLT